MTIKTNPLPLNQIPTNPSLKDLLDISNQNLMINFNCHHIGILQSFDSTKQTATATIAYQKTFFKYNSQTQQYEPELVPYPLLVDCPVVFLGGGSAALTFPVSVGDECLILFNDRDLDYWFAGSQTSGVATSRLHSFSDGIILVGIRSAQNVIPSFDAIRTVLRAGQTAGSITAVGVNPSSSKVLITNTYPANAVTLNSLLQNLVTEIKNLVTAINNITVTTSLNISNTPFTSNVTSGTPNNSSSIAAIATQLTATATQIAGLLE